MPDLGFCDYCGRTPSHHQVLRPYGSPEPVRLCQLRNGHLVNAFKALHRKVVLSPEARVTFIALKKEVERRDREGWFDGQPEPRLNAPSRSSFMDFMLREAS